MDKQSPQIGIATLANPKQDLLATTGMLAGNQSKPGGRLSAILEVVGIADSGNKRTGGNRANAGDLADTPTELILLMALFNLLVELGYDIEKVRHMAL